MSRKLIATGVLGWGTFERQSKEYGYIAVEKQGYGAVSGVTTAFYWDVLNEYEGEKVRMVAVVREARASEHVGDKFLFYPGTTDHLKPTTPELGQEIEIGVGYLQSKRSDTQSDYPMFGVNRVGHKAGGRFQMDPERLYQLHDQTVDVYLEKTADPCSPPTRMVWDNDTTQASRIDDGSFQLNAVADDNTTVRPVPVITELGDGLYGFHVPDSDRFQVKVEKR